MDGLLTDTIQNLTRELELRSASAGRKLSLALEQLSAATLVEHYQGIGVIVRDAWIEFGQSIFRWQMVAEGEETPSRSDAKRLVEHALKYYTKDYKYLMKMAKHSFDLSNNIQHDVNATSVEVVQLLSSTALCMTLINDVIIRSAQRVWRPYYKCPNCGSLKLEWGKDVIADFDGPVPIEILRCLDCKWYYIEDLGGVSGIGQPNL